MTANREYLCLLSSFIQFGPTRIKLLLKYFNYPKKVWEASLSELIELGLRKDLVQEFNYFRKNTDPSEFFANLNKKSVKYCLFQDDDYPQNIRDLDDAPICLFYAGHLKREVDANSVAIIGSRKMSRYGAEVAQKFASELGKLGIVIISGLALGIDAVAHKSALRVGGRCIAVVASGLDLVSPITNRYIAREIIKTKGAIVSEYPLGTPPLRAHFPRRNRIISGLSKAVIVVEGQDKSGTLITASAAAEQGKTVFAVPGPITSVNSQAPHFLIKNGAKLVSDTKDILEELDLQITADSVLVEKAITKEVIAIKT